VPTKDNPKATVATAEGKISVKETVSNRALRTTLESVLSQYPGVRRVRATVNNGVVTLQGQVTDDNVHDDITELARQVEGVRVVINAMRTDDQVMSAYQVAMREIHDITNYFRRNWLLILLSLAIIMATMILARLFNKYSETLLAPFIRNVLLRSVVGSVIGSMLALSGILLALSELRLTQVVMSILGVAGVVGLAVGFAFKDITENFIASVLLGVRRPFQIGDYIQVAGQAGVVKTLTTRATVLVTLEGNHVRIPNATIFKEIMVNSSASSSARGTFDVMVPYEVSTAQAIEAVMGALSELEGVLTDPAPRALVQALESGGIRLRTFFWMPTQGVDGDKLQSDAKLKVKVALQQAGILPPPTNLVTLTVAGRVPVEIAQGDGSRRAEEAVRPCSLVTPEEAKANLRRDSHAAAQANGTNLDGRVTPLEHVREASETHVSEEGTNLLANGSAKRQD
jgi:small-conductance mechanosensitive channel